MIYPYFIGGAALYAVAVSICYMPGVKSSAWYFPIGLLAGLLANTLWLHLARTSPSDTQTALLGLYWDAMLVGMYVLLPALAFSVRFTMLQGAGLLLVVVGVVLTKL